MCYENNTTPWRTFTYNANTHAVYISIIRYVKMNQDLFMVEYQWNDIRLRIFVDIFENIDVARYPVKSPGPYTIKYQVQGKVYVSHINCGK